MDTTPRATVVGMVTPHLLRVVDLANDAQNGVKVDWHVREAVTKSMNELGELYTAPAAMAAYIEGLEIAVDQAPKHREAYIRTLQAAADAARRLKRD